MSHIVNEREDDEVLHFHNAASGGIEGLMNYSTGTSKPHGYCISGSYHAIGNDQPNETMAKQWLPQHRPLLFIDSMGICF